MNGVLTVDVGTTSLRASLYDAAGGARHVEQRHNPPDYLGDGRVEQDPRSWQEALVSVLRGSQQAQGRWESSRSASPSRPALFGAAGRRRRGALHPAILWQDTRCAALVRELAAHDGRVHARTGLTISPVFSAVKMRWLRENRPEVWSATHKLLGVQDWVLWLLSGRYVTDHSFASRTNLFDLRAPRLGSGHAGAVRRARANALRAGAAGCGGRRPDACDGGADRPGQRPAGRLGRRRPAVRGARAGPVRGGHAVANTGTGSYLVGHADAPVLDERRRVSCNVSAVPGAYIVEAAMLSTGAVHRWLRGLLAPGNDDDSSFRTLDAEAARAPAGCNGLVLLPTSRAPARPTGTPRPAVRWSTCT